MLIGTYRVETTSYGSDRVFAAPCLWQEVLAEITAEVQRANVAAVTGYAQMLKDVAESRLELKGYAAMLRPTRRQVTVPEIWLDAVEYRCEHCGRPFLSGSLPLRRRRLCSNQCELAYRRERDRLNRRFRRNYQKLNAPRAAQRAEARAGRPCDHCSAPIEAARSSRRYCSDLCRVRVHRERRR